MAFISATKMHHKLEKGRKRKKQEEKRKGERKNTFLWHQYISVFFMKQSLPTNAPVLGL
jgi:hypothetical protein